MPGRFDEFWGIYPLRVGKKAARKAWDKAMKAGAGFDDIKAGVVNYIAHKPTWQAWRHPATFLNGEHWLDEYDYSAPVAKTREESRLKAIAQVARRPWGKARYPADDLWKCVEAKLLTAEEARAAMP